MTQLTCHRRWSLDWPRAALWSRSSNAPSACHPPATTPPGNTLTQPLIPCIIHCMIPNLIDTWHLICCMTSYWNQYFVNSCITLYTIIFALLHTICTKIHTKQHLACQSACQPVTGFITCHWCISLHHKKEFWFIKSIHSDSLWLWNRV